MILLNPWYTPMGYRIISVLEEKNERLNNLSKGTQLLSDEAKIQNWVYLQSLIFLLIQGAFLEDIK